MPEQTTIVISSFGWRRDVDFTRMPKTEVRITSRIAELVDQGRRIWAEDLKFERSATTLKVKIPLQAVHYPQRIFISARTLLNETPLDWTSWQVMELVPKGQ